MEIDDDCQIIGLLGRELLGWGVIAPDPSQFAIFYRPEGKSFVEQCPWSMMGVSPPPLSETKSDHMRYFTSPTYDEKRERAEVMFVTTIITEPSSGRADPPYINQTDVILERIDGAWKIMSKTQGPRT